MKQTIPLIPLWKWMLELVLGSILFAILYGLGMSLQSIPQPTAKCAAILFSAAVILAMFPLWIKLFEKQWRCTYSGPRSATKSSLKRPK